MKAGIIGQSEGQLNSLETFDRTVEKRGFEAREVLDLQQSYTNLSGNKIGQYARFASQEVVESEQVQVSSDGDISKSEIPELEWTYSEFLITPDGLVIVGQGGDASTVFRLIENQTNQAVNRARIDLDSYLDEVDGSPWSLGFYGKGGSAEKGVVYGVDVLSDDAFGSELVDSSVNQLGLEFERDGQHMKVYLAESGYAEVYQPDDFDSVDFIEYIKSDLFPYFNLDN